MDVLKANTCYLQFFKVLLNIWLIIQCWISNIVHVKAGGRQGGREGYHHKSGSRMHLSYSSDEGNRNLYAGKQQVKSHLLRINAASGPPLTFHSPTPACVPLVEARSVLLIDISSPSHDLPLLCEE